MHTVHALASQVLALAPADKVVPIDPNAFKRPPPWMNGMAGGVVLLFLLMKVGQRLPGGRGVPTPIRVADRAIDIMSLFTAATIVAAFGNLGLVSDLVVLVQTLYRVIGSWLGQIGFLASIAQYINGIAAGACVVGTGWWYSFQEDVKAANNEGLAVVPMLVFGMACLAAMAYIPFINPLLSWWLNHFVAGAHNIGIDFLDWFGKRHFT